MRNNPFYPFNRPYESRYTFTSTGKKDIQKVVDFTHTGIENIVNMGFGDLSPDGTIDDKANSNNGDIVMVLSTVVQVLIDFTTKFPKTEIFFAGSTEERTRLYKRIVKTYFSDYSKDFIINILVKEGKDYLEYPFDPSSDIQFIGFIIKRIS